MDAVAAREELTIENVALEYNSLRGEILKRIELRHQHIVIAMTVAGVFLGVGVTTSAVALIYPPLAVFLAIGWAQNDLRIRDLSTYIRERLEAAVPVLQWETSMQRARAASRGWNWRYVILAHGGIFVFTQFMAIVIGLFRFGYTAIEWLLLAVDVVAVVMVLWIVSRPHR